MPMNNKNKRLNEKLHIISSSFLCASAFFWTMLGAGMHPHLTTGKWEQQ